MGKKTTSKKGRLPSKSQAKAKKNQKNTTANTTPSVPDFDFASIIAKAEGKKTVLHVGCGNKEGGSGLHNAFKDTNIWHEIRLDIDPALEPDVLSDMRDMHMIPNQSVDAIWSSHNIEHVYAHEVVPTLAEFRRVLKPGGSALIATPNLEQVAKKVAQGNLEGVLYNSPSGPITALDIIYGFSRNLAQGYTFMAHKTGFTSRTLAAKLVQAGFGRVEVRQEGFNLLSVAQNVPMNADGKPALKFFDPDINQMMSDRDELDKEPVIWKGFPPKN